MIIKGPYQDVSIPNTALTPFVLHRAKELADKPAEEGRRGSLRMQGAELKRGEREE